MKFAFDIELFEPCERKGMKWNNEKGDIFQKLIAVMIPKKDKTNYEEWWPRLIKSKVKNHRIKPDWDKWADPDDDPSDLEDFMARMFSVPYGSKIEMSHKDGSVP